MFFQARNAIYSYKSQNWNKKLYVEVFSIKFLLLLFLLLFRETLCNCGFWKVLYKYEFT